MATSAARRPWPIAATVGGPIDPEDHIGHEAELHEVLLSTASVGALLTGDRRMGKTSLLGKAEQCLTEHVVVRISAETDDVDLFGRRLLDVLRRHRVFADELQRWSVSVDVGYAGIRLRRTPSDRSAQDGDEDVDDLFAWAASRAAPAKLVLVIDEITVLANAIERQRPGGASEFLRSLRRPRQEIANVVVILSGSVGLHHAVVDMAPLNDLRTVRVGPLAPADAAFLARCLVLGEELAISHEPSVVEAMVAATDGIPYYLHHVAAEARRRGEQLTPAGVDDIRRSALTDPDDPWNLRHYRDRLDGYYGADRDLVAAMLDTFATAAEPLTIDQLATGLGAVELSPRPGREQLLRLVEDLEADHYLARHGNADAFSTGMLRDAWRSLRRL